MQRVKRKIDSIAGNLSVDLIPRPSDSHLCTYISATSKSKPPKSQSFKIMRSWYYTHIFSLSPVIYVYSVCVCVYIFINNQYKNWIGISLRKFCLAQKVDHVRVVPLECVIPSTSGVFRGAPPAPPLRRAPVGNTTKSLKSGLKKRLERLKNQKFSYPGEGVSPSPFGPRFFPRDPPWKTLLIRPCHQPCIGFSIFPSAAH